MGRKESNQTNKTILVINESFAEEIKQIVPDQIAPLGLFLIWDYFVCTFMFYLSKQFGSGKLCSSLPIRECN